MHSTPHAIYTIRRKFRAFLSLNRVLSTNYPAEDVPKLEESPSNSVRDVKVFLGVIVEDRVLVESQCVRQFLELDKEHVGSTSGSVVSIKSALDFPLRDLGLEVLKNAPSFVTLRQFLVLIINTALILPLFGTPALLQPFALCVLFVVCAWNLSQEGSK